MFIFCIYILYNVIMFIFNVYICPFVSSEPIQINSSSRIPVPTTCWTRSQGYAWTRTWRNQNQDTCQQDLLSLTGSQWLLVWDILVFLNFRFAIFLRIWFLFHSNLHFPICYKSVQNLVIVWRFLSHCLGMPFWQAHGTFTLQFQIWSWDVITYIFGHQMTPLARVAKLATWWHHSH